jgi:uncharacterized membrane protein YtjA (UPF0391 family)
MTPGLQRFGARHGGVGKHPGAPTSVEQQPGVLVMLKWAIIFAIIAIVAGALGFTGVAGAAATIAKLLFFVFLVICVIFLVLSFTAARQL